MNKRNVLALALAAVMLLCVLTGCGKKEPLVKEIAGIDPETTVMTINGAPISAELYYYWLTIVCEDTAAYFSNGIEWDTVLYDNVTTSQYIEDNVRSTLIQYQVISELEKEYAVLTDEEKQAYRDQVYAENVEGFGSEEAFEESLANAGVSLENLLYLYETQYAYTELQTRLYQAGGPLEIADSEIQGYIDDYFGSQNGVYSCKHILLKTVDDSYQKLDDTTVAEKKATAESLVAQLQTEEDPSELFDKLMEEHNEDTGEPKEGYTFGPGEMVDAFYDGTAALEVGQVSGIVESPYGYHIILRVEDDIPTVEELRESYILEEFSALFGQRVEDAYVEYNKEVSLMSPKDYYTEYAAG